MAAIPIRGMSECKASFVDVFHSEALKLKALIDGLTEFRIGNEFADNKSGFNRFDCFLSPSLNLDALLADLQNSVPGQPQQPAHHHNYSPVNGGHNGASPGYGSVRKQAASPTSVSIQLWRP